MDAGIRKMLLEKPAGLTAQEIKSVYEKAKETGTQIFVGYNRRFYSSVLKAQEMVKNGGGVKSFNFEFTEWSGKVKNHIYYSDVFERNGDAGGQYGYPPGKYLKTKMNYNFDLARLATTIIEFFDQDSPIFDLLIEWTNYKENGIHRNFNQLDDNFDLYVTITKYARNSNPRNQLKKEIFNLFKIDADSIPNSEIIYEF